MSTGDKLLRLLEGRRGEYMSGEAIAEELKVSRTAVWKAINALRGEGFVIDAVTNRGYRLNTDSDVLSEPGVTKYLRDGLTIPEIEVHGVVTSTNTLMREKAQSGAPEGYTIIAGQQSAGRGRLGRSFYSPSDTGVYISVLLRPSLPADKATFITTAAAVSVCEAVEAATPAKPQIKWVNDVFIDGRKVCGILTEASFGLETGRLDYAIVGVGINVYAPDGGFPSEIADIAGPVLKERATDMRCRIAAEFLNSFERYYKAPGCAECVASYKKRSMVTGKRVNVIAQGLVRPALVTGIGDDCSLCVRYDDGSVASLCSGEISIRPIKPDESEAKR